jgi:hypothetical protein
MINFFRVIQLFFFRDRSILSFENEENTDAQLVSYTCGSIDIRAGVPLRLLIILRRVATREKTISFAIWCARALTGGLFISSLVYIIGNIHMSHPAGDGARKHIRIENLSSINQLTHEATAASHSRPYPKVI